MLRTLLVSMLLAGAVLLVGAPPCVAQSGCGVQPVKPVVPVGCSDLVAVCTCDVHGYNCHWQWQCVQ